MVGLLKIVIPTAIVLVLYFKFPVAILPSAIAYALWLWYLASTAKTMPVSDYDRNDG